MKVGVIANRQKPGARAAVEALGGILAERGIELVLEEEAADLCGMGAGVSGIELGKSCDVIAVLGGDGTMLNAAAKIGPTDRPVAGINIGTLGFLTSCTDLELEAFGDALVSGEFSTTSRTLLVARVLGRDGVEKQRFEALNEVALARGQTGRLVSLSAYVDGELLNRYRADGLIVATPTGSTAYSLSAGGPLISPEAEVMVITPICPHTLSQRSLVLSDDVAVELVPESLENEPMLFTVDGRESRSIEPGDRIEVLKAGHRLHLLRLRGKSFYEALRQKLGWRGG